MVNQDTSGDPDAPMVVVVGMVGAIIVFAIIVALQALFYNTEREEAVSKMIERDPQTLRRLESEQLEKLHGYRWIDRDAEVVAIPIDQAMDLVTAELGRSAGNGGSD